METLAVYATINNHIQNGETLQWQRQQDLRRRAKANNKCSASSGSKASFSTPANEATQTCFARGVKGNASPLDCCR